MPVDIVEILLAEIEIVDIVGQIGWIGIRTVEGLRLLLNGLGRG